jgi:site-specific DNA-methyltransferase (adenine-specific)
VSAHVVHLGDCVEGMKTLADGSVTHVITDPPYSRDVYTRIRKFDSHTNGSGRWTSVGPGLQALRKGEIGCVDDLVEPVSDQIARLTQRWVLVFSDVEFCDRWRGELTAAGLKYVRTGAWVKPDAMPQMTGDRPGVGFEPCTIAHAATGKMRWNGGGRPALWTHGTEKQARPDHPCPKSLALMEQLIRDFTDPGDLVLDPFAGSGTTGVACKKLGRRFVGWELSPKYQSTAQRRIDATHEQLELARVRARAQAQGSARAAAGDPGRGGAWGRG